MARIPESTRQVPAAIPVTSSRSLPTPSVDRINLAGTSGRGLAGLGEVIQRIGIAKQQADDKIELDSATISLTNQAESIIANNSQNIQDPKQFEATTNKQLQSLFKTSQKNVGIRNKGRFGVISQNIASGSTKAVNRIKTSKVLDVAKAQRQIIERNIIGEAANNMRTGKPLFDVSGNPITAEEDALAKIISFTTSQWDKGLISSEDMTASVIDAQKELTILRFDVLLSEGKIDEARNAIETSPFLTNSEKIDVWHDVSVRFDKAQRRVDESLKGFSKALEFDYDRASASGSLGVTNDFNPRGLSEVTLRNDVALGFVNPENARRILKDNNDILAIGGVGNERVMNLMRIELWDNFSINNNTINGMADTLNVDQRILLKSDIAKRDSEVGAALTTPLARAQFGLIKQQYRAVGIFSGFISEELNDQLVKHIELYNDAVLRGTDPRKANLDALEALGGTIPGVTDTSKQVIAADKALQVRTEEIQKRIAETGGAITRDEEDELIKMRQDLENLEGIKRIFEELKRNVRTGQ